MTGVGEIDGDSGADREGALCGDDNLGGIGDPGKVGEFGGDGGAGGATISGADRVGVVDDDCPVRMMSRRCHSMNWFTASPRNSLLCWDV